MRNKESITIRFLYNTRAGRFILKFLINPKISEFAGKFLNCRFSKFIVSTYVKKHKINLSEYKCRSFNSFNEFFIREKKNVKIDRSPFNLISPCDGYLSVYKIKANNRYKIKNINYSVGELLNNEALAGKYVNGLCFVFRLAPDNYHRYLYIDDGIKSQNYTVKGVLHCVRPVAASKYPIYIQNSREYTILNTVHFGTVVQVEVGALLVGKIQNHHSSGEFFKGQEKGYFEFGGSTIILLFEQNIVTPDKNIIDNTLNNIETKVKAGEKIAVCTRKENKDEQ